VLEVHGIQKKNLKEVFGEEAYNNAEIPNHGADHIWTVTFNSEKDKEKALAFMNAGTADEKKEWASGKSL
jgi:hypothetical protein